jgi:hypothetical protein
MLLEKDGTWWPNFGYLSTQPTAQLTGIRVAGR